MAGRVDQPAGYSGTPLWKKLGFKPGMKVCALNAPAHYAELIDGPNDWIMVTQAGAADALHIFITETKDLARIKTLAPTCRPPLCFGCHGPRKPHPSQKD